jgi:peroxiredoxin
MRIVATVLAMGVTAMAAAPPVIKKAPEFTITEPSGKQTLLSSSKGSVVVLTFVYTTCPHCQDESKMLTKLYKEMAPRGLQVFGVAFNDNAGLLVPNFVEQFGVGYPVGSSAREPVLSYLGISDSIMARWSVPQIVVIDRKGNIRAQSPMEGDPNLQSEPYMRNLIETLLKEPGPATSSPKKTVKPVSH